MKQHTLSSHEKADLLYCSTKECVNSGQLFRFFFVRMQHWLTVWL